MKTVKKKTVRMKNKRTRSNPIGRVVLLIGILLQLHTAQGQSKRPLTEADYALWSHFTLKGIDGSGKWTSYTVAHPTADTLFVQELYGSRRHAIPGGKDGSFNGEYFICKGKDSTVIFLRPQTGALRTFRGAVAYQAARNHFLVHEVTQGRGRLQLYSHKGALLHTFPKVGSFSLDPTASRLAIVEEKEGGQRLYAVEVAKPARQHQIAEVEGGDFAHLKWNRHGTALYAMERRGSDRALVAYDPVLGKEYALASSEIRLRTGEELVNRSFTVTDDGKRAFFMTRQDRRQTEGESSPVQVWNAADKAIYPLASRIDQWKATPHLNLWEPASGHFLKVTDASLPWGGPVGNARHALIYNPNTYEPQEKVLPDRDVYLADLSNGHCELLLRQQSGSDQKLAAAPGGSHILYCKERDWYAYELETKRHTNLTRGADVAPLKGEMPGDAPAYGLGGWVAGEDSVLLYDEYDIWKYAADGGSRERLTNGRERGIVFRLVAYGEEQRDRFEHRTRTMGTYDLGGTLVLSARASDYGSNGFFTWQRGKGLRELVYTPRDTKDIMKAKETGTYVWTEEDAQTPIQLKVRQAKAKARTVFASNPQQSQFLQGRMEIVQYRSPVGTLLNGRLYYPADFVAGRQYPMVVHLYEVQSRKRFEYVNPSLYNSAGFNRSNLTAKGYFVLMPDTVFETGRTGDDALHCVEAAVDEVLRRGVVDPKRIGLIGHSFGGYQTNYIITKSNRFACAIAGAAVTNLVSAAHSVTSNFSRPRFYMVENGQARMGGSLFEEKERYLGNSPVMFANGIDTPLLSWTGQNDTQVDPMQSMEFYLALRRLRKEHIMLVYTNEGHDILGREADADLTRKQESWWDRYLMAGPMEDWMIPQ